MLPNLSTLSVGAVLAASVFGSALPRSEPKVLALTAQKVDIRDASAPQSLRRRAPGTVNVPIQNAQGNLLYLLNATVGTPGQTLQLQLDTGSSDIWLPYSGSTVCSRRGRCQDGSYDYTKSSSYSLNSSNTFEIAYVDGTQIKGNYIQDTFKVANASVNNMLMGLALSSTTPDNTGVFNGIIGVGFQSGESIAAQTGAQYPNFVAQLVNQGFITTQAYSLWLDDRESTTASILFGGIDSAKYHGDLTVLPIQPDSQSNAITSFTVTLDNFSVQGNNNSTQYSQSGLAVPVVLDSGTTLTYLPDAIANAVIAGVGAVNSDEYGVVVPCSVGNTPATLTFGFGSASGPKIVVPISEMVLPFPDGIPPPKFRSTNQIGCQWGLLPAGQNPLLLGDTFLRSAYVVYNLAGQQVAIAQTNFNATDSNIQLITQTKIIPGAASTASEVAAQQTNTNLNTVQQTVGFASATATGTAAMVGSGSTATGTFNLGSATGTTTPTKAAAPHSYNAGSSGSVFAAAIALVAALF